MTTPEWQDRRGMFQKGREVHTPSSPAEPRSSIGDAVRRASVSSTNGLEKTTSNTSSGEPASPNAGRRMSSNTGLFGNLTTHKRGSVVGTLMRGTLDNVQTRANPSTHRHEDYNERRASHSEQAESGLLSGWYNKTFRGQAAQPQAQKEPRKGVME